MNRGAFQCRATGDLEEAVLVFEALLCVSLGDVQWDELRRSQPLISEIPLVVAELLRRRIRGRDVLYREAIDVEFLVIEDRFVHRGVVECEYEYRPAD